jgi:CRP-like cAMP-binding protein
MAGKNLFLSLLNAKDAALLQPHLSPVELKQHAVLFETGDVISTVYFPTTAIVSLVVPLKSDTAVEAAMFGHDGVVSGASALDGRIALNRGIVQLTGGAVKCPASAFKRVALDSKDLLSLLFAHEQTVAAQSQQTAACNASHQVEARLARWLMRARDLSGSDTLDFTQEFLSQMLGSQRATVSIVAHTLQQAGILKYSRGKIAILNPDALHEATCECYDTVKGHFHTILARQD